MKGIVLAGGTGTRLRPLTLGLSKQLLPIYDKPMIFYPLSVLMLAGIREILIVTTKRDLSAFVAVLGDGSRFGVSLCYEIQEEPRGIPQAFQIGEEFLSGEPVSLVLGDNLFWGHGFTETLSRAASLVDGARIFGYRVTDPERFGVVEFDDKFSVVSIEEKPNKPKSSFAITGLYFYDGDVAEYSRELVPSARGELEISDLNKIYLDQGKLDVELLGRGFAWLDTGTHESMMHASTFIESVENRTGFKVGCLEEVAFNNGWINPDEVLMAAAYYEKTAYGSYLTRLVDDL